MSVQPLTPDERALLVRYCREHPIVTCPQCSEALTFNRIGADLVLGQRDFCPVCRAGLTTELRAHLAECTFVRVQVRESSERARGIRQEARETAKLSRQLCDQAYVPGREAADAAQQRRSVKREQLPAALGFEVAIHESERLRGLGEAAMVEGQQAG